MGAPTTFEAKLALGRDSKVYAVDVLKFKPMKDNAYGKSEGVSFLRKNALKPSDITPVLLAISRRPLTYNCTVPVCDAIRFAHSSEYMTPRQSLASLRNISASLKVGGYLFNEDVILQKTPSGFKVVERRQKKS
ncbi:Uncharacterised protein [uncultured archaeon]|nr:Uncharacterised protein [uncultured archaeon]